MSLESTHPSPTVPFTSRTMVAAGIALSGIAWNLFGLVQYLHSLSDTPATLVEMGMTPEQAAVYGSYPLWMTVAFGVGVFGGLAGSVLLLFRHRAVIPVFWASLAGYVVLYIGDITEGVFAALGFPQVAVLTTVVAIAAGLLAWARSTLAPAS